MTAPAQLTQLLERYRDNAADYRSTSYNETQLRREFLDPLFEILGWDVSNKLGYAEAYKHVVHEDHIKIAGRSKAPDYSFKIGSVRKFFLEAKRPSVNITSDPAPALQLRRYAWSAKLPLSILTNFEHLAIYDCRIKPQSDDKASAARIKILTFEEYDRRWEEIADVFSFDAINKGAFDRFAKSSATRRGTATVDEEFLGEIERWRDLLARAILKRNASINSRELNDAVQKTIDRIVFLRIAEDRGIEREGRLAQIAKAKHVYAGLSSYFREADERYNSGLFHFRAGDGASETLDTFTLGLNIDDAPLRDIVQNLYFPKSAYEFSVIPADILGQVYERFLGRAIRVKGRSIEIDEKPDVKKAGGVYYTPSFVVRYVVQRTLGPVLEGRTPGEIAGNRKERPPIRIVDPACGSGSFLIEVYQFLLDWYLLQYVKENPERRAAGKSPTLYRGPGGAWRLTIAERKRILTTHLFGVDIDPQAVEVTKLSLLLKVLEGESSDVLASQIDFLESQRVLPDLGSQIRCGNSLIGEDFYGLFDPADLTEDQRFKVNVFSWEKRFAHIFGSGGFDVVVGNPPYGAELLATEKSYIEAKFPHQSYQLDTYLVFLEQALSRLLKAGGMFGMIIPNPWLTNLLQAPLRDFVVKNTKIEEIVHFTFSVFARARATVDTEIVILEKGRRAGHRPITRIISGITPGGQIDTASGREIKQSQDDWVQGAGHPINIFLDQAQRQLASKLTNGRHSLSSAFRTTVGMKPYQEGKGVPKQTRADVDSRVFDSDSRLSPEYRQYLRGGDISRFKVEPTAIRYIKYGKWLAEPRNSAGFDEPIKILMRQTGDSLVAAVDREGRVCMNNMHVLVPLQKNDRYVQFCAALLNSRLMNWFYQTLNPEAGEALAEVKKTNVDRIPLPTVDNSDVERLAGLSDQIEEQLRHLSRARDEGSRSVIDGVLGGLMKKLNSAVYDLYGLNEAERQVVEADQAGHGL